ncbi:MAG TPA: hypothetical protein VMP03_10740, partial [Methylomirabilota bacterium]|nr:hypothetical protein [Methylomirabilota bacterium]
EAVADGARAAPPPPEPAAVEEAASAEPLTPEPEPVVEIAPAAPAPPEPEPVVEIAPAEPAPPEPVVDVASVEPPAAEPEPAFEPVRSAETAEPPVEAAAPAPAEAPPPAEPGPAAAQPSSPEVELAALAPTEAVDPLALQFPQVSVLDAGSFRGIRQAKAVVVRLADVRPLPFSERCGPDGVGPNSWHCGGIARAELSRFIGRRPVVCHDERDVSTNGRVREVIARCTVGGADLSLWVAANGWGVPADGAPPSIADAAREAAERAVGRHAPSAPEAAWSGAN